MSERNAHSGSQKPPVQDPNRSWCESIPVRTWRPIPASVASSGRIACVAADAHSSITPASRRRRELADWIAVDRVVELGRMLVVACRLAKRIGRLRVARTFEAVGVETVALSARLADEADEPFCDLRLHELVGEHGSHADRQDVAGSVGRPALALLEQGNVGAGCRLEQPFLAERPGAESFHVGHVAVKDDRELAPGARVTGLHRRHTARKSSAASRLSGRRAKSCSEIAGTNQP